MGSYHRVIGIDLGTTYSVVAAYSYDKRDVKVLPNRQNEPTTPSVVYIGGDGKVTVGKAAKARLERDPNSVIFEVKRMMGHSSEGGRKQMARAAGQEFEPELISAHILKELKANAERLIGEPIHDAVITVPAYFKESQKNATREAAKIARLNPRLIINEPTAAAVAYGLESGEPQTFVVYDLGGGTFDVSVVRIEDEKSAEVLGTGGNARLGGGDIDQMLVDWALRKLREQHGRDCSGDAKAVGRIRVKAEALKINLCNEGSPQDLVLDNPLPGVDEASYTLSPDEFDAMTRPLLEKTLAEVDVALQSAAGKHGLSLDDVDAFILVGGSSKIPAVGRLLRERYRKPVKSDLNPDEIVAMGAARMALNYDPSLAPELSDTAELKIDRSSPVPEGIANVNIKDVVSHTLGVGLVDDVYDALIPKDHVIPHRVVKGGYATAKDNQTSILVPVFQGDNAKSSLNTMLGQVVIDGLTPEPKGAHQFEITFALNADGIFEGEIRHLQKNTVKQIKLDRGLDTLTEKRLLKLSEQVASGTVPTAAAPSAPGGGGAMEADPVAQLVAQAQQMLPLLSAERQRELRDLLKRVAEAQQSKNKEAQAAAVAQLTMALMRVQN
ncbi:Hsp70 family protein [Pyxidicoccus caerfyrddinensis]|uniref:Hsp70 family protein n=1 Tax=Pyxidicoccus caerfyrddinensis TaxID=2709663 RepID=UPI0013DB3940|nr:Hsp70 family protein [Pyxidicoccus caerfyrddinensis]